MRVSQFYQLSRTQGSLDFVDVTLETDVPVFISPRAIRELDNEWAQECISGIQSFFQNVISLIRAGKNVRAHELLASLSEPNETRLGLSVDEPAGRAMGDGSARDVWNALSQSQAVKSGLLRDLEEAALFVHGIGRDKISDITTNIIRRNLIQYTQHACLYYGIPMHGGIHSGRLWNVKLRKWENEFVNLPVPEGFGKLLLVPKSIVRLGIHYDGSEYYRHYLLEEMRKDELKRSSSLVEVLKNNRRRVTKKKLIERYGSGKQAIEEQTQRFPSALDQYRSAKDKEKSLPLSHEQLASVEGEPIEDFGDLLRQVTKVRPGRSGAEAYENAIEALLSGIFYPCLTQPTKQQKIHSGRKIIDITYTNMGVGGFFKWLQLHYPSAKLMVECKNYDGDIANPEIDQLCGRFSPSRGMVGLLVCRDIKNQKIFDARCKDAAKDGRGFVLTLTDKDLAEVVEQRQGLNNDLTFLILKRKFEQLIM